MKKHNPFANYKDFAECVEDQKGKDARSPGGVCRTIARKAGEMNPKYADLAYGNEFEKRGASWYVRFNFRSPHYAGDKWVKADKELSAQIERMIKSGKIVAQQQNPNRLTEKLKDAKHAFTKKSQSKKALQRLREAETPAYAQMKKFGLGKKGNPHNGWFIKGVSGAFKYKSDAVQYAQTHSIPMSWIVKKNPESSAAELYEEFHGKPSSEEIEIEYEEHEHENLAALGLLCSLLVKTPFGKSIINVAETKSPKDLPNPTLLPRDEQILLCSNEDANSLYFVGGDQSVDLESLGFTEDEYIKDLMVLGTIEQVTYLTQKHFDNFEDISYYHALGEDSGEKPVLLYDPISCLLSVAGGAYSIRPEGIVN